METVTHQAEKFSQSITFKAIIVGFLTLLLLIPGAMIQSLITERQNRSIETITKISSNWSNSQTIKGPVLTIPYTITSMGANSKPKAEKHFLRITPEELNINTVLIPKKKYYGIYKAILYRSELNFSGRFVKIDLQKMNNAEIHWDEAYVMIGVSDLRGVTNNIDFGLNGSRFSAVSGGNIHDVMGTGLVIKISNPLVLQTDKQLTFNCKLNLKGSGNIDFIPIGKTTQVQVNGNWNSPGFTGNFSPEHSITNKGFSASWKILHFNRNIPETWVDNQVEAFNDTVFGVNLVDTVDQYQQNMRSAKYAILFILLTFVVFFFVEILTKKKIHPIQYLLVGFALILFYSLLLSISEQTGFAIAYIISATATVGLITLYVHSIFRNKLQTVVLTCILTALYIFLYVILQLEDVALLIGSIGLFVILGVIMFFSKRINWYKTDLKQE